MRKEWVADLSGGIEGAGPDGNTARFWTFLLALFPAAIALALAAGWSAHWVIVTGLLAFGAVFALTSATHSFLILAYSDNDKVAMNVGFYYMANAAGRLVGTVLSGWVFQRHGLVGCLWFSVAFVLAAGAFSIPLPRRGRRSPVPGRAV